MRWAFSKTLQKNRSIPVDFELLFKSISYQLWHLHDLWYNVTDLLFDLTWSLNKSHPSFDLWLKTDLCFYLTWSPLWLDPISIFNWSRLGFDIRSDFQDLWSETDFLELILVLTRSCKIIKICNFLSWSLFDLIDPLFDNPFDWKLQFSTLTHVTQSQMKLAKKVQFESRSHSPPRVMESSWFNISLTSFSHKLWHNIKVQWSEWSVSHQSSWPSWGLLKIGQGYLILLNTVSYGLIFYLETPY